MKSVKAVSHVRQMQGSGSSSQLFRCDDGNLYVVKLRGNPQGNHVLANELAAYQISKQLNLPVPDLKLVEVEREVIAPIQMPPTVKLEEGVGVGSLFLDGIYPVVVASTPSIIRDCENIALLPGMYVLDTLIQNEDRKPEHILISGDGNGKQNFWLIDHGHTLGINKSWKTLDPSRVTLRPSIYKELLSNSDTLDSIFEKLTNMEVEAIVDEIKSAPLIEWGLDTTEVSNLSNYIQEAIPKVKKIVLSSLA